MLQTMRQQLDAAAQSDEERASLRQAYEEAEKDVQQKALFVSCFSSFFLFSSLFSFLGAKFLWSTTGLSGDAVAEQPVLGLSDDVVHCAGLHVPSTSLRAVCALNARLPLHSACFLLLLMISDAGHTSHSRTRDAASSAMCVVAAGSWMR